MLPRVSVLTPSYNQSQWLEDNLRSVKNQTYPNIEHIVMDGGSTDGTLEILENCDSHVCWLSEPDQGQSHALNKALAISTGDIIGWINSDDAYVDQRAVEMAVQLFLTQQEVDLVYSDVLLINEQNEVLQYYPMQLGFPLTRMMTGPSNILKNGPPFMQPGVFIRRAALEHGFVRNDLHFCMDHELWLRLASEGRVFQHIPFPLAVDRQQPHRKGILPEYLEIMNEENEELGLRYGRRRSRFITWRKRLIRVVQRLFGVIPFLRIEGSVKPAFELKLDGRIYRIRRQILARRYRMSSLTGAMVTFGPRE